MSNLVKIYRYKNFNIYKMINIGYCFITNNTYDINDTPTYDDLIFIQERLNIDEDNYDIFFHFDGVFGLIVLKDNQRFFSKKLHTEDYKGKLKSVSSYFDKIINL